MVDFGDEMYQVELTQGKIAVIDDEDRELVCAYKWHWISCRMSDGYARTQAPVGRKGAKHGVRRPRPAIMMHNLILDPPAGMEVDHINGNGLDNRRANLRLATRQQQAMNRKPLRGSSKFKGVRKWKGKWHARIKRNGNSRHLGYFDSEEAAARAYDQAAEDLFGEFAFKNFP